MCKISIIIPVYNSSMYLNKSLNSVINQTMREIEIIIVNDGSKDNSLNICKEYAVNDSRIKIIDKKNEGVSIARNKGIEVATGDYIMFIDADDWVEHDMCEVLYTKASNENADIILANHIMEYKDKSNEILFNSNKEVISKQDIKNEIILPLIEEEKNDLIHQRASFRSPWGKLFKRKVIVENQVLFNKELSIGEDFIFNLQYLMLCERAVVIDSILYHYRINEESALNKYKDNSWNLYKKLLIVLEEYLQKNFFEQEYFKRLNKLKIKYFMICLQNENSPLNKKGILQKRKYIKNICNDKIMYKTIRKHSNGVKGRKNRIRLFLLRNKIYFPVVSGKI